MQNHELAHLQFEYQFLSVTKYIVLALIPIVQAIGILRYISDVTVYADRICFTYEKNKGKVAQLSRDGK